jgi:hypothetical protein
VIGSIIPIPKFHEKWWWRPGGYYDEKIRLIKVSHAKLNSSVQKNMNYYIDSLAVICKSNSIHYDKTLLSINFSFFAE